MSQPRTLQQATDDLKKILAWKRQIVTTEGRRTLEHSSPSVNLDGQLPFGLNKSQDLIDDGPTGIRTPAGAEEWLRIMASWAHTSGYGSTPNMNNPGNHILTILESPYNWEQWDDWEAFADDLHIGRKHIGRLTGHCDEYRLPCPQCGGTLRQRMTDKGMSEQLDCRCGSHYDNQTHLIRTMRTFNISPSLQVKPEHLIAIWTDEINPKTLRTWINRQHISQHPDGTINLWTANAWINDRQIARVA